MKAKNRDGYTPIVLFVYNRPEHTRRTIENLKSNPEAKRSELWIFSDAPKKEEDRKAVEKTRGYVREVKGFKKIKIKERNKNYGLSKNLISALNYIFKIYDRAIVLEDDDVPSKHFLKYMNDSLHLYENEATVGAVSGYFYPVKNDLPETFFLHFFSSWGFGIWKRSWDLLDLDGKRLYEQIRSRGLKKKFNINGTYPFTRILRNQIKGNNDSWSIRFYASLFLNGKLVLYPKKSLIKNIGFDDTGTHGQKRNVFDTFISKRPIKVSKQPLKEDVKSYGKLQNYFKSIFWERLFSKIKRLVNNPIREMRNI